MGQRPGHRRQKSQKPTVYAGLTTCLRCDIVFESWDRRQNRLCDACRQANEEQPTDEASYSFPKPGNTP